MGAWWALFALAVQLALSFGHTHPMAGPSDPARQFAPGQAAFFAKPSAPSVPMDRAGLALEYCEVCAVTSLLGNGVPAAAPLLLVPGVIPIRFLSEAECAPSLFPRRPFQARAPPQA
jgi:hypothetical protein